MKEKDLRRLRRADLLEILIEQGKEIERLENELRVAQEKLDNRMISIKNLGTMAEAAFKLNHVYEAVDEAAKQYLENVKERCLQGDVLYDNDIEVENVEDNTKKLKSSRRKIKHYIKKGSSSNRGKRK